jgi:hypothetical protein
MEHLRRKERDTSVTVSEESTLVVRAKLRPPVLREDVAARGRLLDWLRDALPATLPDAFPDLPGHGASQIPDGSLDAEWSGARVEGLGHPELVVPSGHRLVHADDSGLSPRVARSRLVGFRGRCMGQFRVVRPFDEAGGGDSPDHASRGSGALESRVLFDAGWSYRRRAGFSLGRALSRGAPPDRSE